jgi:hypothetical protein
MEKSEIVICENHDYQVPLIWTFAFIGAEYWCPYCGYVGGMLGAGKRVPKTVELVGRREIYSEYYKDYLHAHGLGYCTSTLIDNIRVKRENFSQEMRETVDKFIKEFPRSKREYAGALMHLDPPKLQSFKCVECEHFMDCDKTENGHCKEWKLKSRNKLKGEA